VFLAVVGFVSVCAIQFTGRWVQASPPEGLLQVTRVFRPTEASTACSSCDWPEAGLRSLPVVRSPARKKLASIFVGLLRSPPPFVELHEFVECHEFIGMRWFWDLTEDRECLRKSLFGLRVAALLGEARSQTGQTSHHVGMLVTELLSSDGQGFAVEGLGLIVLPLPLSHPRQVTEGQRNVEVIRSKSFTATLSTTRPVSRRSRFASPILSLRSSTPRFTRRWFRASCPVDGSSSTM